MRQSFRIALLALAVVGLLGGGLAGYGSASARGNAAVSSTTPVFDLQDHAGVFVMNPKERGTSDLVRTVDGISINIDTTDLPVGAYTVWWVIFDDLSLCSDGECGENDVLPPHGNAEAGVTVGWLPGGIVGPDRMGHFSGSLAVGLENAPGQVMFGDGLTNPIGAEVHVILRYHGPVIWSDANQLLEQLNSYQGNCTPASSLGVGTDVNAFDCYEPQAAVHKP